MGFWAAESLSITRSARRTWGRAKAGSDHGQGRLLVLPAVAVPRRGIESKAAGEWHAAGLARKPKLPNADEAFRKHVQQEATSKLIERQGHQLLLVVVSRVAPTKGDLLVGTRYESMVGDGHAMGVAAQILEHILGATEGRFGVDHPVLSEQWPQP